MLGTEYNWLITLDSHSTEGDRRVRITSGGLLTLSVAVFCFLCVAVQAEPTHRQLMREATDAAKAGDAATVVAKLEAARALRPDYPRVLNNLARFRLQTGRADEAMATLREMAAMGLALNLDDNAFAALRDRADFAALAQSFAANRAPAGQAAVSQQVTAMDGIIEGFAVDPATTDTFFSDVRNRCIWVRAGSRADGEVRKFSADSDGLLGVFALKVDPAHRTLWASSAALPEMKGFAEADKGRAFLAVYDLKTSRLAATYPVPPDGREHVLGDFVLAGDGRIYVSDSTAPVIWRFTPGAGALEKWLEHDDFISLQGLALSSDGRQLYVADYANGLWRIDVATRAHELLKAPAHSTLFGLDGVYATPGGLVAVQNGISPARIIHIALAAGGTPAGVKVLAAGQAGMDDPALGLVAGGQFHFVGNAGWNLFEKNPGPVPVRSVSILRTSLE